MPGFVHEELLIKPLEREFGEMGARTQRGALVRTGRSIGFVDLFAEIGSKRFVIEAERSARRVDRDLLKAMSLAADELWIVVPTGHEVHAVDRKLSRMGVRLPQPGLFVLTLGQALQRVHRTCLPLIAGRCPTANQQPSQRTEGSKDQAAA